MTPREWQEIGVVVGLYRAAVREPLTSPVDRAAARGACFDPGAALSLESLTVFFRRFLAPLKEGEDLRHMMKLHFREMIEPTGAMEEAINQEIKPEHATLLRMLVADFGLERPDVEAGRRHVDFIEEIPGGRGEGKGALALVVSPRSFVRPGQVRRR